MTRPMHVSEPLARVLRELLKRQYPDKAKAFLETLRKSK